MRLTASSMHWSGHVTENDLTQAVLTYSSTRQVLRLIAASWPESCQSHIEAQKGEKVHFLHCEDG